MRVEGETVRLGTRTRSFGVSKREGHDSSVFYKGKLYDDCELVQLEDLTERAVPVECLDRIIYASSTNMSQLPDNCVHLMVTSPPYNVGKEYDTDLSLAEYRQMLKEVWAETFRVLVPGGRACVNVANLGRKPYIPLHSLIIQDMLDVGFRMRGEVIWNKAASSGTSTAWGSWMSASNPTLRDVHEYILVFSKGSFGRKRGDRQDSITREEFLEFTKSVWEFPAESARRVGHPAPFPIELPYRLISLYSFVGDVVLDPFCGSGTTCLAALKTKRHYIGYDVEEEYVALARRRIEAMKSELAAVEAMVPGGEKAGEAGKGKVDG